MTDWRKPFDRFATVIYVHNSREVFWERSVDKAHIRISAKEWKWLESMRQEWLLTYKEYLQGLEEERQKEIALMLQRKAIRDGMELEAQKALDTLHGWKKYADGNRWFELNEWLETHPQRLSDTDNALIFLDDIDWSNPIPLQESWSEVQENIKTGRPKGTKSNEIARANQREAAIKHWQKLKSEGWVHPATLRKEKQSDS